MDHLKRPFGDELHEEGEIPYMALNDYHEVPFIEYAKTNKAYHIAANVLEAKAISLYLSKLETSELEQLLQTWLFFGPLQEALGEMFNQNDFMRVTQSKVIIATKEFARLIRQWISGPCHDQTQLTHLQRSLKVTMIALHATPEHSILEKR